MGGSGSCARTARRCRQSHRWHSWEGAPLAPTDARLAAAGIGIGPHTATPEWYGESLDLTATLDVLWEPPAAVACGGS